MKLKCPVCGEVLEVDVDLAEGQRVSCDACDSSFNFRKEYAVVTVRRSGSLPTVCPHCGKRHLVGEAKIGKYVMCNGCQRMFVVHDPRGRQERSAVVQSEQLEAKGAGCLANCFGQLLLFVFRAALVVIAIIAVVYIVDALLDSEIFQKVKEPFEDKANTRNVTSARPQTIATPEPRRPVVSSQSRGLGLIKDGNGLIVGMLGHRLGESKRAMNESGGTWRTGTFGPCYSSKLPNVISGFDYFELEYDKDNRLCSITLKTWFSSNVSHEVMEELHAAARRVVEKDYGLSFHVGQRAALGDGTTFDTYHMPLVKGPDAWPIRQVDLCVVPQNSGGYLVYLSLWEVNW